MCRERSTWEEKRGKVEFHVRGAQGRQARQKGNVCKSKKGQRQASPKVSFQRGREVGREGWGRENTHHQHTTNNTCPISHPPARHQGYSIREATTTTGR